MPTNTTASANYWRSSTIRLENPCAQSYADRVVGLTIEELQAVPLRIGVAGSLSKAAAIQGALCGGYLHTLITDETAAQRVMELQAIPQGS